ncbi:MAG: hypothetical protein KAS32_07125 [Candidatus Peribacteraceae bacterium]|nr:hypothetical protein [Candidatus Peribacteraceae bacterium]
MERCSSCKQPLSLRLFGEAEGYCILNNLCNNCIIKEHHKDENKEGLETSDIDEILNLKDDDERH